MKQYIEQNWHIYNEAQTFSVTTQIPKSVLHSCLEAGIISDPFYRDNEYDGLDFMNQAFIYETTFEISRIIEMSQQIELVFEGLDTLTTIYLNDEWIGDTDNMHQTHRFDISQRLMRKVNTLRIIFKDTIAYLDDKQSNDPLWGTGDAYPGIAHIRKAHYMYGWDWGPKLPDAGIFRPVYLEYYPVAKLEDVAISQEHQQNQVILLVNAFCEKYCYQDENFILIGTLSYEGTVIATQSVKMDELGALTFVIDEPRLWWPNLMGEQPLYCVSLALMVGDVLCDQWEKNIGLRTLTVKREKDQWGESFEFVINGQSIFSKGGNYIPEDNLITRQDELRTERLIIDCVKANMNTIRVWGGGYYPNDYFYELCDKYGLIVWQDLMFACAVYRMTPEFEASIIKEVQQNIKRIKHHPCIGIICGNNEMEEAFNSWGGVKDGPLDLRTDYIKQFEFILPKVVKEAASDIFYWKSSPSSGGHFDKSNNENYGDVHDWNVWHGQKPFIYFHEHYYRFLSEFGLQSFPTLKTIQTFTLPDDRNIFSPIMEQHQKNKGGNNKILHYIAENYRYPNDFESVVLMSQLVQGEGIRYAVEHLRRHFGRCMGTTYWQLNDCWPAPSWSSLDSQGRWKIMHYMAKRFFSPVLISSEEIKRTNKPLKLASDRDHGLSKYSSSRIVVTNETWNTIDGIVHVEGKDNRNEVIDAISVEVIVPPYSAKEILVYDMEPYLSNRSHCASRYISFRLEMGNEILSLGSQIFVEPKSFDFLPSHFDLAYKEDETFYYIGIQTNVFVQRVWLDMKFSDGLFSDNCFELTSHDRKWVSVDKATCLGITNLESFINEVKVTNLNRLDI